MRMMHGTSAVLVTLGLLSTASAFAPVVTPRMPLSRGNTALRMCSPPTVPPPPRSRVSGATPPPPPSQISVAENVETQGNPLQRYDQSWGERTTTLDRAQRLGGDPLAPKKPLTPEENAVYQAYKKQTMGMSSRESVEKEGYEWFKSMESQVSQRACAFDAPVYMEMQGAPCQVHKRYSQHTCDPLVGVPCKC